MRFIVGLLGGLVAGAAGAVWYSQQTGRDLREEFQQVRSEIKARDFDALGAHLEDRFKELQVSVEKAVAEAGRAGRQGGQGCCRYGQVSRKGCCRRGGRAGRQGHHTGLTQRLDPVETSGRPVVIATASRPLLSFRVCDSSAERRALRRAVVGLAVVARVQPVVAVVQPSRRLDWRRARPRHRSAPTCRGRGAHRWHRRPGARS